MSDVQGNVEISKEARSIFLNGDFCKSHILQIVKGLKELEAKNPHREIDIYINSPGGLVSEMICLYETIRNLACKVNTHGMGHVYSAGAFLLTVGTGIRYGYKNSRYMLHEISGGTFGKITDIQIKQREMSRMQEQINKIIANHTGKEIDKVSEDMEKDFYMNAEEALEYGIIDEIF